MSELRKGDHGSGWAGSTVFFPRIGTLNLQNHEKFGGPPSAVTLQLELGSTRAIACSDRRPRRSEEGAMQSIKGDPFERPPVVGEGANHSTRGRVRSPFN